VNGFGLRRSDAGRRAQHFPESEPGHPGTSRWNEIEDFRAAADRPRTVPITPANGRTDREPSVGVNHDFSLMYVCSQVTRNQNCDHGINERVDSRAVARTEKTEPRADSKENHNVHRQRVVPKRMIADRINGRMAQSSSPAGRLLR